MVTIEAPPAQPPERPRDPSRLERTLKALAKLLMGPLDGNPDSCGVCGAPALEYADTCCANDCWAAGIVSQRCRVCGNTWLATPGGVWWLC